MSSPECYIPASHPPGGEFLLRFARVAPPGQKCAFVLTRAGSPVKVQRTIFSECFYTMAMDELWKVTGDARYQVSAFHLLKPRPLGAATLLLLPGA